MPTPLLHKKHFWYLLQAFESGTGLSSMSPDKVKLKVINALLVFGGTLSGRFMISKSC